MLTRRLLIVTLSLGVLISLSLAMLIPSALLININNLSQNPLVVLYQAAFIIWLVSMGLAFIIGIILLATQQKDTVKARGIIIAAGVLSILGGSIIGVPLAIVAFIAEHKVDLILKAARQKVLDAAAKAAAEAAELATEQAKAA